MAGDPDQVSSTLFVPIGLAVDLAFMFWLMNFFYGMCVGGTHMLLANFFTHKKFICLKNRLY